MPTANLSVRLFLALLVTLTGHLCQAQFSTGARILASDINTLRANVNTKRAACGVAPQVWTDDPLTPGVPIKQVHLNELRSAVHSMYVSQGVSAPLFTDPTITSSTPVKAIHFQEIASTTSSLACGATINGFCGPANGNSYATAALATAAGLCASGTASPLSLSGAGPWSWNCLGSGVGHSDAACSATVAASTCTYAGTSTTGLGACAPSSGTNCRCNGAGDTWNAVTNRCRAASCSCPSDPIMDPTGYWIPCSTSISGASCDVTASLHTFPLPAVGCNISNPTWSCPYTPPPPPAFCP